MLIIRIKLTIMVTRLLILVSSESFTHVISRVRTTKNLPRPLMEQKSRPRINGFAPNAFFRTKAKVNVTRSITLS